MKDEGGRMKDELRRRSSAATLRYRLILPPSSFLPKADRLFAGRNPSALRSRNMRASRTDVWP